MQKPKRIAAYAWLNQWFGKEKEGAEEPPLATETVEALRCTKTGYTVRDLGGETGQTLNAKLADSLLPPRSSPPDRKSLDSLRADLRRTIGRRIGLKSPQARTAPKCSRVGKFEGDEFLAEKLELESEPGILLPALLLTPKQASGSKPVILHAAELGKPAGATDPSIALDLVRRGYTVLSIDVRGAGETDPRPRAKLSPLSRYDARQFQFDTCAVQAAQLGTTMLAMQTTDVLRAVDYPRFGTMWRDVRWCWWAKGSAASRR